MSVMSLENRRVEGAALRMGVLRLGCTRHRCSGVRHFTVYSDYNVCGSETAGYPSVTRSKP